MRDVRARHAKVRVLFVERVRACIKIECGRTAPAEKNFANSDAFFGCGHVCFAGPDEGLSTAVSYRRTEKLLNGEPVLHGDGARWHAMLGLMGMLRSGQRLHRLRDL